MIIKEFRYIYNINQANFYLKHNIQLIETGVAGTGKTFYKFKDSRRLQEVYKKWLDYTNNK